MDESAVNRAVVDEINKCVGRHRRGRSPGEPKDGSRRAIASRHAASLENIALKRFLLVVAGILLSLSSFADQNQNYPFSIETEKEGDGHRIVAHNNGPAPISVKVTMPDSQNSAPDRAFPVYAVVPPGGGTLYLARIRPAVAGVGYTFRTQSSWMLGDLNARQSPDALYRLPYQDGAAYPIGQAFGGPITTHTAADNRYAVDIGMPQDAPVVAARDGTVIYTEANQVYGGQSPDLMSKANEVRIQHIDGTIAVYAHLAHGGVFVYPGQRVTAGTRIGLAGSTGFSSGPHLHFVIQTVERYGDSLRMVSLPFQFYVGDPPAAFAPLFGMVVSAEYASPSRGPGTPASVQIAAAAPQQAIRESVAAGNPELVVSFELPAQVLSWLLSIPAWKWIGGTVAAIFLLVLLDKTRQSRRRQRLRDYREPTIRSRAAHEPIRHGLTSRDRLIIACEGDRQRADRLQEFEYQRSPGISNEDAAQRAWERLQLDRR